MGPSKKYNQGFAYVLALLLLAIFSTLAVAFASTTDLDLQKSNNSRNSAGAQMAAESGLAFMLWELKNTQLPANTTEETLLDNLSDSLAERLEGTTNLGAETVAQNGGAVTVPLINYGGNSFSCSFTQLGENLCRLTVTGQSEGVSRTVSIDLTMTNSSSAAFDYGIASRGKIAVWGHSEVVGVNDSDEAKMLSILDDSGAIDLRGNVNIEGELFLTDDDASVEIQGNSAEVAGETDKDAILSNHVHTVPEPEFPEVDTEQFADLATGEVIDSSSNLNKATYDNIRIAAGTNPQFGHDVVINGIVYVEAPNVVTFKNDCVINGMIVTEDGSDYSFDDCQLIFKSKVSSPGVEASPDTPEFDEIKEQTGTFVLGPGFGVDFRAQVNTINGVIAADKVDFRGHVSITVKGSILGLTNKDTTLHGHNTISIDSSGKDKTPAGFLLPKELVPIPGSYAE
ncbi:MAG: hypothetical protein SVV80_10875 [Planctomycetota bacterium]|nr:hypothetical protein [Planctomycetota bacterium]